jgi:glutamine amidotransferase
MLGLSIGMQLIFKKSEEGRADELELIKAKIIKFVFTKSGKLKIPHMGWKLAAAQKTGCNLKKYFSRDGNKYTSPKIGLV